MLNFAVYMNEPKKNIFQLASEWGLPFGLYLSLAAVASLYADVFPPLGIVFWVMVLGTPFLAYYFQRRKYIEDDGFTEYAALWMLGILLFILGAVLSSFVAYLVLRFLRPEYMYEVGRKAIEAYNQIPEMRDSELLHVVRRMVDERLMPPPIEMVINTFWLVSFLGSITSAVTALAARHRITKRNKL